jgi:antigen flippase
MLVGGSTLFRALLALVRNKAMAHLLGPGGYGLMAIYQSIIDTAQSVAAMGLNSSGVRQVAESAGAGDSSRLSQTISVLRRTAIIFAVIGAVLLAAFCKPIAQYSFGNDLHALSVAWLGLAILLGAISNTQLAVLQGMRRIADMARASALGGFFGTLIGIPMVYFWGERGVVPSLIFVGVTAIATSWWYSRQIKIDPIPASASQASHEASALLKLGFVFMITSLVGNAVPYLVRVIVRKHLGFEAAGNYSAAFLASAQFVGIILTAMAADFFPRLTAAASDHRECNRLVNEQAEISLLLAAPGLLGIISFSPLVIQILASNKFSTAPEILRWICLGMMLRVASWPMGYILLAKGERRIFFWSEIITAAVSLGLIWLGVHYWGLNGAGMAFFSTYIFYWFFVYAIVRSLTGFRWAAINRRIGLFHGVLIAAVFTAWYYLPVWAVYLGGGLLALLAGIHSLKTICTLVPLDRLPRVAQRLIVLFRLNPSNQNEKTKQ